MGGMSNQVGRRRAFSSSWERERERERRRSRERDLNWGGCRSGAWLHCAAYGSILKGKLPL